MAIARASTTAPQCGQPQQFMMMATICGGCQGKTLDMWGCQLSPCPLLNQYSGPCASHTPSRRIINNVFGQGGFPLVPRIPGSNGEIIHWVGLGGRAVVTCTPDRTTDKHTINVQNNSNYMPTASMQCLNAMPQYKCLHAMPNSPLP